MPRRWLSKRAHKLADPSPSHDSHSGKPNPEFDFAFRPNSPSYTQRPTTSNGLDTGRPRKKFHIDAADLRPQTSDTYRALFRPAGLRSREDAIGIALGSPSHPPVAPRSLTLPTNPASPDHAFSSHEPGESRQRRSFPRPWKKIGALFTGKHATQNTTESPVSPEQVPYQQSHAGNSAQAQPKQSFYQYRVQIQQPTTRNSPSEDVEKNAQRESHLSTQKETTRPMTSGNWEAILLDQSPSASLYVGQESGSSTPPKLDISIPNQPLSIEGARVNPAPVAGASSSDASSSLLEPRRSIVDGPEAGVSDSKTVHGPDTKLASEGWADTSKGDLIPAIDRANLSPPTGDFHLRSSTSSPTLRKYSLFPSTMPSSEKSVGQAQQASPLRRSFTSPPRLSPVQSNFPTVKSDPVADSTKPLTNQDVTSPVLNTASTETTTAPWSAITSQGSSLCSSADEIFFDVKSFRDSRGMEDGKHFVMSRPDAAVVEFARSMSRLKSPASKEHADKTTTLANDEWPSSVNRIKHAASDDSIATTAKMSVPPKEHADKTTTLANDEWPSSVNRIKHAASDDSIATTAKMSVPPKEPALAQEVKGSAEEAAATSTGKTPAAKKEVELKIILPDSQSVTQNHGRPDPTSTKFTVPSPIAEELSPGPAISLGPDDMTGSEGLSSLVPSPLQPNPKPQPLPPATPKEAQQERLSPQSETVTPESDASETRIVSNASLIPAPQQPAPQSSKLYARQVQALQRTDHPIQESPTIPQSLPPRTHQPVEMFSVDGQLPPPVPHKDTKYIPLSKYAPKKTLSKIESVGFRPARLDRAATDSLLPRTGQLTTSARGTRVERSATIPVPRMASGLRIQSAQDEGGERVSPGSQLDHGPAPANSSKAEAGGRKSPMPTAEQADLTAEVSVARTVSLTRKQSSRVLVPGPKLGARRRQASEEEKESRAREAGQNKEKQADSEKSRSSESTPNSIPTLTLTATSSSMRQSGSSTKPLSNLHPLASHPMDSQASLVSHSSQLSQVSYHFEMQEKADRELLDEFNTRGKGRKEVHEGMRMSPVVVVEGLKVHKPGASVGVVLDTT